MGQAVDSGKSEADRVKNDGGNKVRFIRVEIALLYLCSSVLRQVASWSFIFLVCFSWPRYDEVSQLFSIAPMYVQGGLFLNFFLFFLFWFIAGMSERKRALKTSAHYDADS